MNLNEIQYKFFTASERANLTLSAIARGDREEMLLLQRSTPRYLYKCADIDYHQRINAIFFVTALVKQFMMAYQHKLELTEICAASLSLLSAYHPAFQQEAALTEKIDCLCVAQTKHLITLKSALIAFQQFCDDMNIDFANLLTIDNSAADQRAWSSYLAGEQQEEAAFVKQFHTLLTETWQSLVGEDNWLA